jgi:hypothetical protein
MGHRDHHRHGPSCHRDERRNRCCKDGRRGPTGPTGPTGPSTSLQAANIYNVGGFSVSPGDNLPFDNNGVVDTGFSHTPGSDTLTVLISGVFSVQWSTLPADIGNNIGVQGFVITVNNVPIPATRFGPNPFGSFSVQTVGEATLTLVAGDALRLQSISQATVPFAGTALGTVNVSLNITQVR